MESDRLRKKRLELAEALRKGGPAAEEHKTGELQDTEGSLPLCRPEHIIGDYYYATDSLGERYVIRFINRTKNHQQYYANKKDTAVPPEGSEGILLKYAVTDETTDTVFQILRYSVIALDISEIINKFKTFDSQEE